MVGGMCSLLPYRHMALTFAIMHIIHTIYRCTYVSINQTEWSTTPPACPSLICYCFFVVVALLLLLKGLILRKCVFDVYFVLFSCMIDFVKEILRKVISDEFEITCCGYIEKPWVCNAVLMAWVA